VAGENPNNGFSYRSPEGFEFSCHRAQLFSNNKIGIKKIIRHAEPEIISPFIMNFDGF
jgi:hypothetical protein